MEYSDIHINILFFCYFSFPCNSTLKIEHNISMNLLHLEPKVSYFMNYILYTNSILLLYEYIDHLINIG